jgi:hypothetical protein
MEWCCRQFRTNPIVSVELGELRAHANGLPALPYQLALKNGRKLEGLLPMNYDAHSEAWFGTEDLDWHLRSPTPAQTTKP